MRLPAESSVDLPDPVGPSKIIYLKLAFIIFVVILSVSILFILVFYNLDARIDYIIEWNYFLLLLVFYFLSSIMWKKEQ